MRQDRLLGWAGVVGTALILILAFAAPASAKKFQMTGTWAIRNGQVFIPLQFAQTLPGGTMTSQGNLSKAFFFPNGPIPGAGVVSGAAGGVGASLMIPQHRFLMMPTAQVPLQGVTLVQITSHFVFDAPYQQGTFVAGGGPGSFTWCPNNTVGCAPPPALPNGGTRNGRIIYSAGANQFGGAIQIGLSSGGINSFVFNAIPFQVGHAYFGGAGTTIRNLAPGIGTPNSPGTEMVYLAAGVVTQPTMTPTPNGLVLYPGPRLTTMLGLTTSGTGATFMLPALGGAVTTMGAPAGQITSNYGFAHTTGTIIGQQTVGTAGADFFTFMGSDMRTPLGAGNISTVAGGISFRNTLAGQTPYISMHKIWLSLAFPTPSMSPAGFAAAGALMLLAVGYALRRRLP